MGRNRLVYSDAAEDGAPNEVVLGIAMGAFRGRAQVAQAPGADFRLGDVPLERFVFRDVTWISYSGVPVVYDGDIDFDPAWRPRTASIRRPGAQTPASLALTRDGTLSRQALVGQLARLRHRL